MEQQSKALLKLPNKKERTEIESLEALLDAERKEARSREARHKLTVERLKDQIQELQVTFNVSSTTQGFIDRQQRAPRRNPMVRNDTIEAKPRSKTKQKVTRLSA